MKKALQISGFLLLTILVLILGLATWVQYSWPKRFDAPLPAITASTDTAVIRHGEYLVYGPAHCADCHIPVNQLSRLEKGEKLPLIGGHVFALPFGDVVTPNLTPDPETGIGRFTDAELARALRYNVGHDGHGIPAFMAFMHMSDEDVTAIISYLRSREAVKSEHASTHWNFMGRLAWVMGMIKPDAPTEQVPVSVRPDTTAAYGKYLADGISNCKGCHTDRDMKTGAFTSPFFSGGFHMPSELSKNKVYVTPNLTPDSRTGWMKTWTEAEFVARFRKGRVYEDSPMPWTSFKNFSDNDLKALYRYLQTLKPVSHETGPAVVEI